MSHLVDLASLPPMEIWGDLVRARRVDGERMTMAVVELGPDASIPEHHHPHEQMGICIQGSLRLRVGDEVRDLEPGGTWRIPPEVPHEVSAGPAGAIAIDVFTPLRSDWDFPMMEPCPPRWPPRP